MAAKIDRLGETRMMNCGMAATIIRYGNTGDIDVRFEDGAIIKHRTYDKFKKGGIANPNMKVSAEDRLGETRMMNCGMEATIIRYNTNKDIDVRFKDGAIAKHKAYDLFKKGRIANPNMKASRLGETQMMNCGMKATIFRYGTCADIDVRFEDGTVAKNKTYRAFKKGEIANPKNKASRLGETRMMNCGMEATIIRYGRCDDIDVRFKDGAIAKHKTYNLFKEGGIANPNMKASAENRLGETRMMNCGTEATIIRYGGATDIDVRFEDGAIVENRTYREFKNGEIINPNTKAFAENRLGETQMMNCGMEATIIRYGRCDDIDVRFKDGAIAKHKTYNLFKEGGIANPNMKASAENRLGETRMMNCGTEATIIRYGGATDIDVRFEDGAIVENRTYREFKNGEIINPNTKAFAENRLGETQMMNCGMEATVIRYGKYSDIDVRFEDEAVAEHKAYDQFKRGTIAHRSLSLSHGSKDFHGFICKQGFKDEDRTLYECICKHCGLEDVLTPQEMMEHEKIEHGKNK